MFVYLSKFLPQFIYPAGLLIILLICVLILLKKHSKTARNLVIAALLIMVLGGNRVISYGLAKNLEWRYLPPVQLPQAEVIVLLGGGTESADSPRSMAEVNSAGDRVLYAGWLYKQGAAPNILLSGGNISFSNIRGTSPAAEMQQILSLIGIPESALWMQNKSQNTYEDALFSAQMLNDKSISRVILVTSAMHMPRSVALFEAQGIEVIPAPTDYTVTDRSWQALTHFDPAQMAMNLMPSASALNLTTNVLKEHIGMLVYRLQGWME
jgi:uncharacterized SAM-binding protein YcdF (DUF218 family)